MSIVTPEKFLSYCNYKKYFKNFVCPEVCIITFENNFLEIVKTAFSPLKRGPFNTFLSKIENLNFGIHKSLLGTPSASISLECLRAIGFKKFISLGSAGALNFKESNLNCGDIVVGQSALRDEALSDKYISSDHNPIENKSSIYSNFIDKYPKIPKVISWTTDAPYMETREKFLNFTSLGASIVEMEMASLLAVAISRKIEMLNLFVISDLLSIDQWQPGFFNHTFKEGREKAVMLIKDYLHNL